MGGSMISPEEILNDFSIESTIKNIENHIDKLLKSKAYSLYSNEYIDIEVSDVNDKTLKKVLMKYKENWDIKKLWFSDYYRFSIKKPSLWSDE